LFDKNREPRALERSLHRRARLSEDVDIVDQMLRPDDGDIQIGVSVTGPDGDAPADWREMVRPRQRNLPPSCRDGYHSDDSNPKSYIAAPASVSVET
jgi:hypothetical protein